MWDLRSPLCRAWMPFVLFLFLIISNLCGHSFCFASEDLYETRLDKGLTNTEPYSYVLMGMAHADKTMAKTLLEQARKYSPDLPAVYFELAKESFSPSAQGVFQWLDYFRQGMEAYGRNFFWEFSIVGLVYASLLISFVLSMVLVLAIRFPLEAGLILHDGAEDRKRLFFLAVPVVLSLFGPIALITGAFFVIGLYFKKENKVVVYAAFLFFVLSPFFMSTIYAFLSVSPTLKAMVATNEGRDNRYAIEALRGKGDFGSVFSYALALKREGNYQGAVDAYKSLISSSITPDPRVLINLGNSYYGLQDIEAAKHEYQRSIQIAPLPPALYNLSQIYREQLDFAKGDQFYFEAVNLDPMAVSEYRSVTGRSPNRFVVDETLPLGVMWRYALRGSLKIYSENNGLLAGFTFLPFVIGGVMIPMFYLLHKKVKFRAVRCTRCGSVFCSRCSRVIAWGEMCPQCYRSLIKIDEIDSRDRITGLLGIYQGRTKRRKKAALLSSVLPGAGQIYSGKMLAGFVLLWAFLLFLTLTIMNGFFSTGLAPFGHVWIPSLMVPLMALTYVVSVLHIRRRIQRGWL